MIKNLIGRSTFLNFEIWLEWNKKEMMSSHQVTLSLKISKLVEGEREEALQREEVTTLISSLVPHIEARKTLEEILARF